MAKVNPFRFSTKYQDDEIDLLYYGYRYLSSSLGRWITRDPIHERGGPNLSCFIGNEGIRKIDVLGLDYQLSNPNPPTGWWLLSLRDVDTLRGFGSRYLASDGRYGHPACPCRRENIVLVQAVRDPLIRITKFDFGPDPKQLPAHKADDPVPPYDGYTEPLTIIDAPHFTNITPVNDTTWHFEDCAICRNRSGNSVIDQILGCIRFDFTRHTDGTVSISVFNNGVEWSGHGVYVVTAQAPTAFWGEALKNWQDTGTK